MAHFSDRIKSLRIERGITQEQLAAMLKISRSTIGMYEAGKREPDFETSEAIADIFNVDMDYLTGRSDIQRMHPITPTTFIPTIYDRIKQRRLELGLTVEELAQKMGYKDKSSISKIENGKADIPQSKVVAFARALNTTTAFLIGVDAPAFSTNSSVLPGTETDTLPRVGRIACGEPILAEQNIKDYDSAPSSWRATFTLTCVGDSMAPHSKARTVKNLLDALIAAKTAHGEGCDLIVQGNGVAAVTSRAITWLRRTGSTRGDALRRAREAAGMTMRQLAEAAGVSTNTVSLIEAGRSAPRADVLKALATALGTTMDAIWD